MWHNLPCPAIQVVPADDVTFSDVWRGKVLFSFFRISSQQASILVIPSPVICCSLLFRINVPPETLMTGFSESKPLRQLRNRHGTLLRLRLRLRRLVICTWLPNFKKIVERELLIMGVHQFKDIFSIVQTNLLAWLDILCLGAKDEVRNDLTRGDVGQGITVYPCLLLQPVHLQCTYPSQIRARIQFFTSESIQTTRPNSWILKLLYIWMGIA